MQKKTCGNLNINKQSCMRTAAMYVRNYGLKNTVHEFW